VKKRMTTCGSSFAISDSCTCVVAEGCLFLGVFWTYFWTLGRSGKSSKPWKSLKLQKCKCSRAVSSFDYQVAVKRRLLWRQKC
jgi:hypothetical protein